MGPVIVRPPQSHELDSFASLVESAFLFRFPASERERFLSGLDPERCLVALEGGRLLGTLASHERELTVPGPSCVPVAALTDLAVSPTHRRQGHLGAMLRRFFSDAHDRGEPLALLDASAGGLYGRFGFGPASWGARYRIDLARAARRTEVGTDGVVLLQQSEAREVLPEIFQLVRRSSVGEISRPQDAWEALFEEDKGADPARFFAAHGSGELLDSYVVYEASPQDRVIEVQLRELVASSNDGYQRLWGLLLDLDGASALCTGQRPTDEPIRHLLRDPRALLTVEVRDRSWLRLVDVVPALALRRYGEEGEIRLFVSDEQCPWNEQTLLLESGADGRAAVSAVHQPPELRLTVGDLSSIYLGATTAEALLRAGQLEELVGGAVARADRLFRCERSPFQAAEI